MKKETTPAHICCTYFDSAITYLERNHPEFLLKRLAEQIGCSTETIRRKRQGQQIPDAVDLSTLASHYQISPLYLLSGISPIAFKVNTAGIVNEAEVPYNTGLVAELNQLRLTLADKEKIIATNEKLIAAYEKQLENAGAKERRA